jgi:hypothetical protein
MRTPADIVEFGNSWNRRKDDSTIRQSAGSARRQFSNTGART